MGSNDLEAALDALFAAPPERFLEARDALVKQLKAGGDKEASARVKSLHKPTQAAHALNRLAREAAPELDEVLEVGRALASGKDFKVALDRQRAAIEAVSRKAIGPDVPALLAVVRGAQVDPALAAQLRLGRFSKLPAVQVGFFGAAPAAAAQPAEQGEARPPSLVKAERKRTKEEVAAAVREARTARLQAEEQAARAREAEAMRRKAVEEAEQEAATLADDAKAAERHAVDARHRAEAAAAKVARLKPQR